MALLTKSKQTTLTAASSVLTSSLIQGLAENFGLCACVLDVTRQLL